VNNPTIRCQITSRFILDQSDPENKRYVFSYTITIRNLGQGNAKLLRRYWLITDANGKQYKIEGEGVVGVQPDIAAYDEYTYSSGTVIETPVGIMQGHYLMENDQGERFNAEIEPFRLAIPNILH
jgi:ApaG protein